MFRNQSIKSVVYASLSLGLAVCSLNSAQARSLAEIQKSKVLKASTEGTFPPFNMYQGKKLTGFEVELAEAVAQKLNVGIEWKTYNFDSLLIGLNQNRYDLVASSHGITDERLKAVDFSSPHYCTGGVIVVKAGGPKKVEQLKGKTVAIQVGTTYLTHMQAKHKEVTELKTYPKDTDCLQTLLSGRVDAWITDKFVALDAVKANPAAKLEIGDMLFQERVAMAVAKGNSTLLTAVNNALAELLKDGTYEKLSKKYFNQDIRCQ